MENNRKHILLVLLGGVGQVATRQQCLHPTFRTTGHTNFPHLIKDSNEIYLLLAQSAELGADNAKTVSSIFKRTIFLSKAAEITLAILLDLLRISVFHQTCNVNVRTNRQLPQVYEEDELP